MKTRSIVLSFMVLTLTALNSQAQSFHFGVKGGGNVMKVQGRSLSNEFKWGFTAGGYAEIKFGKFGIQPELLFNQTNTQTGSNFNEVYNQALNSQNVQLNYLTVPVLLTWSPVKIISIQVGPQFGYLINQTQGIIRNTQDAFKKGDISAVGGAQLNLGKFKLGGRYILGANELSNMGRKDDSWKSLGMQFYLGFRIL